LSCKKASIQSRNPQPVTHSAEGSLDHLTVEDKLTSNTVKKVREGLLLSKAELSRKARLSPITIDRVEKGMNCRMETKRKIILALGLDLSDKEKVFPGN
jgi:DNA-binding XRE family transcriptional regulator